MLSITLLSDFSGVFSGHTRVKRCLIRSTMRSWLEGSGSAQNMPTRSQPYMRPRTQNTFRGVRARHKPSEVSTVMTAPPMRSH